MEKIEYRTGGSPCHISLIWEKMIIQLPSGTERVCRSIWMITVYMKCSLNTNLFFSSCVPCEDKLGKVYKSKIVFTMSHIRVLKTVWETADELRQKTDALQIRLSRVCLCENQPEIRCVPANWYVSNKYRCVYRYVSCHYTPVPWHFVKQKERRNRYTKK